MGGGATASAGRGGGGSKAFGDDSSDSSGEEMCTDWMKKRLEAEAKKGSGGGQKAKTKAEAEAAAAEHAAGFTSGIKRQAQVKMAAAIKEDPTVYQYDEVYEDMAKEKAVESKAKHLEKQDRKPQYIQNLLKQAEVRERERERRVEHKVQKEREAEGEEFRDKEAFVTS